MENGLAAHERIWPLWEDLGKDFVQNEVGAIVEGVRRGAEAEEVQSLDEAAVLRVVAQVPGAKRVVIVGTEVTPYLRGVPDPVLSPAAGLAVVVYDRTELKVVREPWRVEADNDTHPRTWGLKCRCAAGMKNSGYAHVLDLK
jgi:hypothetical protein